MVPSNRSLQLGAHHALWLIRTECIVNSYLPLHFSNFLLQTSSLFWTLHLKEKLTGISNRNFLITFPRFPSPLTQGSQEQSRKRSHLLQLAFLLSLSLHLWPWPSICVLCMCLVWRGWEQGEWGKDENRDESHPGRKWWSNLGVWGKQTDKEKKRWKRL